MNFNLPPSFISLPVELLTEIIRFSNPKTQASLCRVSKGLNFLSIPILYNDIFLQSFSATYKCLLTFSTCPALGAAVRLLHIAYNTEQSSTEGGVCKHAELLQNALTLMPNLLCLAVNPPQTERDAYENAISKCLFPKLDTFIWSAPFSLQLLQFLTRHRDQLITVAFNFEPLEPITIYRYSLSDAEPIILPGLVKFYGELHHVRLLGAEDTLKSVTGQWTGQESTDFENCMISLGQTKRLVELDLMWPVLDIIHLEIISRHVKTLQDLTISLSSVYVREHESNDIRIKTALSRFPDLLKLSIRNAGHHEPGKAKFSLDEDYRTVKVWGDRCPSLAICITPRHTRWIRCEGHDADNTIEWVPTPLVGEARKWYKNAILNDIKPGWKKAIRQMWPPGVMVRDALKIGDSELMDLLEYSEDEKDGMEEQEIQEEQEEEGGGEGDQVDLAVAQSLQSDPTDNGQGNDNDVQDAASETGAE
ncbi:hypothetical protein DFJ43DRAFT_1079716 [Lentinula guzmanii]|uniref:F-box domain-containing protein n=1 Tax=Lentinula guzmanii TaxID=2804957 RepID=A0AA38JPI1_9AGAR|nr:hypothetical protein DFJ43DRAFT_1079716 [Lentinula guzmanii]